MTFSEEKNQLEPYTLELLYSELEPLYVRWWDEKRLSEIEFDHAKMMEKLFKEKDRFVHIFETEKGSVYFQTVDGCVRVCRFEGDGGVWKRNVETPTKHLYYMTENTMKELDRLRDKDYLGNGSTIINIPFPVQEIEVGIYPLEFGFWNVDDVKCDVIDDNLYIYQELGGFGIHNGDKIVKIIE